MSDWLDKVHAHADGETSPEESQEAMRLVESDPRAAAEHQWATYLPELLRSKCAPPDSSEAWKAGLERLDAIDAVSSNPRVENFVGRFSWAFAASLFVVIVVAGFLNWGRMGSNLSGQELASALNGTPLSQSHSVEGANEADEFLKSELGTGLPSIRTVFEVHNVSSGEYGKKRFVRIEMSDASGALSMVVFEGVKGFEGLQRIAGRSEYSGGQVNGQNCIVWSQDGFAYTLIAERSVDALVSIADDMRR